MKASDIEVMSFKDLDKELLDERIKLAKDAKDKLGYKKLAYAIAIPGALLFKLRELGIEPLQINQVLKYMNSKVKVGMYSGTKIGIMFACFLVIGVLGTVWLGGKLVSILNCVGLAFFIMLSIAGFLGSIIWSASSNWEEGTRTITEWVKFNIQEYTGNIPEHALAKAIQIYNVIPEAKFDIIGLVEKNQEYLKPKKDPFLVVSFNNESYYIDVWDEKEYEARI